MLCKGKDKQHTSMVRANAELEISDGEEFKSVYGFMVKSHESTRHRVESSQPDNQEDRISGKGFTSMSHDNLLHKFIPMPQAMKIPDAEAAVVKALRKLETIPAWDLRKVKSKKEVILEA